MGGIATVVWTDTVLFLLFLAGIGAALWTVSGTVEGGLAAALESGWSAGKMRLFDLRFDLSAPYTLWAAVIASTWGGVGFYGTDQLLAQRLLCCQDVGAARRAVLASYAAILVTALVAVVGVALWAHYQEHAMSAAALGLYEEKADRLFPIFVVEVVPHGLKGLIVAGALAAAISSLDSIVAALSQTTQSLLKPASDSASALKRSRALVVFWSLVLGCAAVAIDVVAESYASILDLALAMASYTGGALLAGFLLAFLPHKTDGRGFPFAACLSVLAVFAVTFDGEKPQLRRAHVVKTGGACPRNFAVLESHIVVGNQDTNELVVFRREVDGNLTEVSRRAHRSPNFLAPLVTPPTLDTQKTIGKCPSPRANRSLAGVFVEPPPAPLPELRSPLRAVA